MEMVNRRILIKLRERGDSVCDIRSSVLCKKHEGTDHLAIEFTICGFFIGCALVKMSRRFAWTFDRIASCHVEFVEQFLCVCRLRQVDGTSGCRSMDVKTEKLLNRAKIVEFEFARESVENELHLMVRFRECKDIVDVDCEDDVHVFLVIDEY